MDLLLKLKLLFMGIFQSLFFCLLSPFIFVQVIRLQNENRGDRSNFQIVRFPVGPDQSAFSDIA